MRKPRQYRGGYQSAQRTTIARQFRKEPTTAEAVLWERLRSRRLCGFKFRRQHQFGEYLADFYCNEARLVIECDGDIHSKNENWNHDQVRDAYMRSQGLRVLRFTNRQVLEQTGVVIDEIAKHLNGVNVVAR